MPLTSFTYLSVEQIIEIHRELVGKFSDDEDPIGSSGPVDGGQLLRSAVSRPMTSMGSRRDGMAKYPKVEHAAAALTHSLVHNHPFPDGNKRTATLALIAFLYQNKRILAATEDELYELIVALAQHRLPQTAASQASDDATSHTFDPDAEVEQLAEWIADRAVDFDHPKQRMQWRKLRTLLVRLGCTVTPLKGNKIRISIGRSGTPMRSSHIGARNDGDVIDHATIKKVKRDLQLPSLHTSFGKERGKESSVISEAIEDWRNVLIRLGELDRGLR